MVRSSVIIALVAFVLMSVNCSEDSNFEVTLVTNNATNLEGKAESLLDYTVTHTFGRREFGNLLHDIWMKLEKNLRCNEKLIVFCF